jgi:heat shock protein HslJ
MPIGHACIAGFRTVDGPLEVEGDTLVVQLEFATEQGCTHAESQQDESLTSFLESRPSWTLEGDSLTLTGAGDRITFQRHPAEPR